LVVGSLSKTSAAVAAGARTQFANLLVVVFCFLTLVFVDAAVPRHAAPGVRRHRHRGDRSGDL
jgi:hypothetical protein